jgi:hypothetical protein
MSKNSGKPKRDEYESAAATSRSEEELRGGKEAGAADVQGGRRLTPGEKKAAAGGIGILGCIVLYLMVPETLHGVIQLDSQYRFKVFCPYNKIPIWKRKYVDENGKKVYLSDDLRFLTEAKKYKEADQYVIFMQMHPDPKNQSQYFFRYCSWVTDWEHKDSCENAEHVCSIPGPIFYVQRNKPIEVAWVYELDNK